MKKSLLLLALLGANAMAAPIMYGQMNAEMRYIDQDADGRRPVTTVAQTYNLPSRLGAFGSFKSEDFDTTINYIGEFGIMTRSGNSSATDAISIRLANVAFTNELGTFTIGRQYTATALDPLLIDPLYNTGAAALSLDQWLDIKNAMPFMGVYSRLFQDAIKYATPVFAGFQLQVSVDNNSVEENKKVAHSSDTDYSATYYSAQLAYNLALGESKTKMGVGFVKGTGIAYNTPLWINTENEERYSVFVHSIVGPWAFNAYYAKTDFTKYETTNEYTITNMSAGAAYTFEKNKLALTYANAVYETPSDEQTQYQVALGYQRNIHPNVIVTATGSYVDISFDKTTANDNKAYVAAIGTMLNF